MTALVLQVTALWVRPGQAPAFERSFAKVESLIHDAEGRLSHELRRSIEHDHHYALLVEWRRLDDLTRRFQPSAAFARVLAALQPWLERAPETETFQTVPSAQERARAID